MKIKVIGHSDLDQVGSELAIKRFYGKDVTVDVTRCNYNNVNGVLYSLLKDRGIDDYARVYITDISISPKMAEWIDKSFKHKVVLIDHHINEATAHLSQYDWVTLKGEDETGRKISATKLVAQHFHLLGKNKVFDHVVHMIDSYDVWHWKAENYLIANELNRVAYMIGFDKLLDELEYQVAVADRDPSFLGEFIFKSEWELLLEVDRIKYERYLEGCNKSLQIRNYKEFTVGYVFAEQYISEVGNDLAVLNPNLDFVAIVNMRSSVSLRGVKKGIHLGNIAKEIGDKINSTGGGHELSSGCGIPNELKDSFVDSIFFPRNCEEEFGDDGFEDSGLESFYAQC